MMVGGYMRMIQSEVVRCDGWSSAHCCGWSKGGTDGPLRTPNGIADCHLGAPMGGNQHTGRHYLTYMYLNVFLFLQAYCSQLC